MLQMRDEIEPLLLDLVKRESVVNTDGERDLALYIFNYLGTLPYFQKHPDHLKLVKTKENNRERYSCLALVKGQLLQKETVILMGHFDTVGIDDFGKDRNIACHPEKWKQQLTNMTSLPEKVQTALESDNWMFGRGTVDMKSGVATNLFLTKHFSERITELNGNILLVAECDEEDGSKGILSVVEEMNRWAEIHQLQYVGAINNDYTTARYEGDENRYIYMGTVGKLLPSFFVAGLETHVGEVFSGFDPNLVLSELTKEIDYNPELCDEWEGEFTVPPITLKQTDMKPYYDVQTPLTGFSYYNFLVHRWSPQDVLDKLKDIGENAFANAIHCYESRYQSYAKSVHMEMKPVKLRPRVYTFAEYYRLMAEKNGERFEKSMQLFIQNMKQSYSSDIRYYCRKIVEEVWRWDNLKQPVMVIFYSSLYSPRVLADETKKKDRLFMQAVKDAVEKISPEYEKPIQIRKFFPYISDMSFVSLSDDEDEIESYKQNMPAWENRLFVPFDEIRKLDVPVVNIGPYGFDAHKKWERVEIDYSLEVMPNLIYETIQNLLAFYR